MHDDMDVGGRFIRQFFPYAPLGSFAGLGSTVQSGTI